MLSVKVPKEIKEYQEKVALGLSLRQILFLLIAFVVNVGLYILLKDILNRDILSWLIIINAFVIFCFGFIEIQGMPFDKFFMIALRYYTKKQKLVYENFVLMTSDLIYKEEKEHVSKKERKQRRRADKKLKENQED